MSKNIDNDLEEYLIFNYKVNERPTFNSRYIFTTDDFEWEGILAALTEEEFELVHDKEEDYILVDIELLDVRYNKTYHLKDIRSYYPQRVKLEDIVEEKNADKWKYSLNDYLISSHYCGCNRENNIQEDIYLPSPDDDSNESCPSGRWLIVKAVNNKLPDVILYKEIVIK